MKLTMVGTGYVGLVTGACLANTGNTVTCLDVDERKIKMLRDGKVPIYEPGLEEMIHRNVDAGRLFFTLDKQAAYRDADAIFICVGTPPDEDGSADLKHVLEAAGDIADTIDELGPDSDPKLIVVKSTVPVGSTHLVAEVIRKRTNTPFLVADNPEFLKEGAAINDFMKPDRVVCGVDDERAAAILRDIYEPFVRQGNPIFIMDVRSAEMVKYASNAMLACKISFINEIALLCERYGADIKCVREGMCSDTRIGGSFYYPGLGYGGSCFPKDTSAVVGMGKTSGFECLLNASVHEVNQNLRPYFWNKISEYFDNNLSGKVLAFWGASFKPETDDIREAPAICIMKNALDAGATVRAFDPAGLENLHQELPEVECVNDMYDVLNGADAMVLCTEWSEFRHPDFDVIGERLKDKVIFDGRNIYRRKVLGKLGFTYISVGRPPVTQPTSNATA